MLDAYAVLASRRLCMRDICAAISASSVEARLLPVCLAKVIARAFSAIAPICSSSSSVRARMTSSDRSATKIALLSGKKRSRPAQRSLISGVPHAAASNNRTLGEWPAATMSARVTLSVKRMEP